MNRLPTLIVIAPSSNAPRLNHSQADHTYRESALDQFNSLDSTLRVGLESGLRVLLVAPAKLADQARKLLPSDDVIDIPQHGAETSFGNIIASGVLASAQSSGWLLMPTGMAMMQAQTLRQVAQAVMQHPMVIPIYKDDMGLPLGFSSEFFSELIRINDQLHLSKLINRYPFYRLEINDPSILIGKSPDFSFAPWSELQNISRHIHG